MWNEIELKTFHINKKLCQMFKKKKKKNHVKFLFLTWIQKHIGDFQSFMVDLCARERNDMVDLCHTYTVLCIEQMVSLETRGHY
jgi:hypothetical protein